MEQSLQASRCLPFSAPLSPSCSTLPRPPRSLPLYSITLSCSAADATPTIGICLPACQFRVSRLVVRLWYRLLGEHPPSRGGSLYPDQSQIELEYARTLFASFFCRRSPSLPLSSTLDLHLRQPSVGIPSLLVPLIFLALILSLPLVGPCNPAPSTPRPRIMVCSARTKGDRDDARQVMITYMIGSSSLPLQIT